MAARDVGAKLSGLLPLAVVANVGTTSTTSVDPPAEIAAVCEQKKAWLHVDAACGRMAATLPSSVLAGAERANSVISRRVSLRIAIGHFETAERYVRSVLDLLTLDAARPPGHIACSTPAAWSPRRSSDVPAPATLKE